MEPSPVERIWRLAALISGDTGVAAAVTRRVVIACREPAAIGAVRLDRLAVLWTREEMRAGEDARTGRVTTDRQPIADLPTGQPREAWMLARVEGFDMVRVARSMDCSRTAAARYLEQAEHMLGEAKAEREAEARAWLSGLDSAGTAERIRGEIIQSRRRERLIRELVGGVLMLLVLWGLVVLIAG